MQKWDKESQLKLFTHRNYSLDIDVFHKLGQIVLGLKVICAFGLLQSCGGVDQAHVLEGQYPT